MKGSDHVRMTRAEITGESEDQLVERQLVGKEPIFTWYTGLGPAFPFADICIT